MKETFRQGLFVISLDFELFWGVRDKRSLAEYRARLSEVPRVIKGLLGLFEKYRIHATWATVGALFLNSSEGFREQCPELLPGYEDENLCPYQYARNAECLEAEFHFAPRWIRVIADRHGQEVGTHTYSHFYCLEQGVTRESFVADISKAASVALEFGLPVRSLVFPRNQWREDFLEFLPELGIVCYRGNPSHSLYRGVSGGEERLWRRALRLLDTYVNLSGHHTFGPLNSGAAQLINIPASRFLRAYSQKMAWLDPLKRGRIVSSMHHAARNKEGFHLWWHPHNFGVGLQENLAFLEEILIEYQNLRDRYGMLSINMGEVAQGVMSGELLSRP